MIDLHDKGLMFMPDVFIHLVRHGETDWNARCRLHGQSDSMLSELGKRQAVALSEQIKSLDIKTVYCSPSFRAQQTADILMQCLEPECDFFVNPLLHEISLGPWEGMYLDQVAETHPVEYDAFFYNPDQFLLQGAETFYQLQSRAVTVFKEIAKQHINEQILLVTHCAFIKTLLAFFEPRHMSALWQSPQLDNCSHSILRVDTDNNVFILQYTQTLHA